MVLQRQESQIGFRITAMGHRRYLGFILFQCNVYELQHKKCVSAEAVGLIFVTFVSRTIGVSF